MDMMEETTPMEQEIVKHIQLPEKALLVQPELLKELKGKGQMVQYQS